MEERSYEAVAAEDMEILPPERVACGEGRVVCICCGQSRFSLEEDGCGICDECLAA
jgi:hypothetical protein